MLDPRLFGKLLIMAGVVLLILGVIFLSRHSCNQTGVKEIRDTIPISKSGNTGTRSRFEKLNRVMSLYFPQWLGHLPGDIVIKKKNFSFYFPILTCLLASGLITLILWLFTRR